jgi:hypothetical protein
MKPTTLIFRVLLASALWGTASLFAGDMDQNLIARWTFKDGSLKSDVGDFEFQEGGRGSLEAGAGKITLSDRKFLFCPGISAEALPELQNSVTLWARVKLDERPKEGELGVMGLQAGPAAGSWSDLVFSLLYRPMVDVPEHAGMAFLARPQNSQELGVGERRFQPVSEGQWFNVAIVFNGTTHSAGMWVSSTGQFVDTKLREASALQDFGAFLIGKLFQPGAGTPVTFDEVRIYSTALDAQWLEEITPVEDK